MISKNGLRDSKSSYDMIEQEENDSLTIFRICRHGLSPLCKIVNGYDDVTMPPGLGRITMHIINTPFGKWANGNDGVYRSNMSAPFGVKMLTRWTAS